MPLAWADGWHVLDDAPLQACYELTVSSESLALTEEGLHLRSRVLALWLSPLKKWWTSNDTMKEVELEIDRWEVSGNEAIGVTGMHWPSFFRHASFRFPDCKSLYVYLYMSNFSSFFVLNFSDLVYHIEQLHACLFLTSYVQYLGNFPAIVHGPKTCDRSALIRLVSVFGVCSCPSLFGQHSSSFLFATVTLPSISTFVLSLLLNIKRHELRCEIW